MSDPTPPEHLIELERRATEGDARAAFALGFHFHNVQASVAQYWYRLAIASGHVDAMFNLSRVLQISDPGESEQWLRRAAEAGQAGAMLDLGHQLQNTDAGEAKRWYERAATAGEYRAAYKLSQDLAQGNPEEASRWAELAKRNAAVAAQGNDPEAMSKLAYLYDGDREQSVYWYRKAAAAGDIGSMVALSQILRHDSPSEAQRWDDKAVRAGSVTALYNRGLRLEGSNPEDASNYYQLAAEQGDAQAMLKLGILRKQEGDFQGAITLWRRAAELGNSEAMWNLGVMFLTTDRISSRTWFQKAYEIGNLKPPGTLRLAVMVAVQRFHRRFFSAHWGGVR